MSSLGETLTPGGETGTVTKLQHMPDQLPDNPATLSMTTSIETLQQVMYSNWIWRNNFTVDQSMRAGHIFGLIKIHPRNCNDYITHISEMFLTWTGSMKLRSRFMATFQFGGSIRLGFLPPAFTQTQVFNLPISTLTAYPNIDLDPKNTDWVEFQASEERNIMFHWMKSVDDEDPASFGGYFVFYVASPLVISGESAQISLLVESAGAFQFAQLSPLASAAPVDHGWLANSVFDILNQPGCDDGVGKHNAIQICATSTKSLPVGFAKAHAVRVSPTPRYPENVGSGGVLGPALQFQRSKNNKFFMPTVLCNVLQKPDKDRPTVTPLTGFPPSPSREYYFTTNTTRTSLRLGFEGGELPAQTVLKSWIDEYKQAGMVWHLLPKPTVTDINDEVWSCYQASGSLEIPVNVSLCAIDNEGSNLSTMCPNESIVLFVNTFVGGINLQTAAMSQALSVSPIADDTLSQIYHLYAAGTVGPIAQFRLQPNGMFSTNAVVSDTLLAGATGPLSLVYVQDLLVSSPLPPMAATRNTYKLALRAQKKAKNADDWRVLFWNALNDGV